MQVILTFVNISCAASLVYTHKELLPGLSYWMRRLLCKQSFQVSDPVLEDALYSQLPLIIC